MATHGTQPNLSGSAHARGGADSARLPPNPEATSQGTASQGKAAAESAQGSSTPQSFVADQSPGTSSLTSNGKPEIARSAADQGTLPPVQTVHTVEPPKPAVHTRSPEGEQRKSPHADARIAAEPSTTSSIVTPEQKPKTETIAEVSRATGGKSAEVVQQARATGELSLQRIAEVEATSKLTATPHAAPRVEPEITSSRPTDSKVAQHTPSETRAAETRAAGSSKAQDAIQEPAALSRQVQDSLRPTERATGNERVNGVVAIPPSGTDASSAQRQVAERPERPVKSAQTDQRVDNQRPASPAHVTRTSSEASGERVSLPRPATRPQETKVENAQARAEVSKEQRAATNQTNTPASPKTQQQQAPRSTSSEVSRTTARPPEIIRASRPEVSQTLPSPKGEPRAPLNARDVGKAPPSSPAATTLAAAPRENRVERAQNGVRQSSIRETSQRPAGEPRPVIAQSKSEAPKTNARGGETVERPAPKSPARPAPVSNAERQERAAKPSQIAAAEQRAKQPAGKAADPKASPGKKTLADQVKKETAGAGQSDRPSKTATPQPLERKGADQAGRGGGKGGGGRPGDKIPLKENSLQKAAITPRERGTQRQARPASLRDPEARITHGRAREVTRGLKEIKEIAERFSNERRSGKGAQREIAQTARTAAPYVPVRYQIVAKAVAQLAQRLIDVLRILPKNAFTRQALRALQRIIERLRGLSERALPRDHEEEVERLRELKVLSARALKIAERDRLYRERERALEAELKTEEDYDKLIEEVEIAAEAQAPTISTKEVKNGEGAVIVYPLSGVVYSRRTGLPVPGVVVNAGPLGFQVTGVYGEFTFPNVPEGASYSISVNKPLYGFSPNSSSGIMTQPVKLEFAAVVEPLPY